MRSIPSSTIAIARIRRDAPASFVHPVAKRSSGDVNSVRVIETPAMPISPFEVASSQSSGDLGIPREESEFQTVGMIKQSVSPVAALELQLFSGIL